MNAVVYLLISVFFNTSSHLFLKRGVVQVEHSSASAPSNSILWNYVKEWSIWAGILLNGFAALFWLLALSLTDLSYAFPFLSINYIMIPLGARLLFKERLSRTRIIGIIVICVGIFFIAIS